MFYQKIDKLCDWLKLVSYNLQKNKTLFTPACELECQYITFDIFYNGPNVIFYIGLKCTFEVKECIMINILYALKQLKK